MFARNGLEGIPRLQRCPLSYQRALADPLPEAEFFISVISRIELLSFPGLDVGEETLISRLLQDVNVVMIDDLVEAETIRLRRTTRLKMADAIIAASATVHQATLYTHDKELLKLAGLITVAPPLR